MIEDLNKLLNEHNFVGVERLSSDILSKDPQNAVVYYLLGKALALKGEAPQAAASFKTVLSLSLARSWHVHSAAAAELADLLQGRPDDAVDALQFALRQRPYDAKVRLRLGRQFEEQGQTLQAAIKYRQAMLIDPGETAAAERFSAMNEVFPLMTSLGEESIQHASAPKDWPWLCQRHSKPIANKSFISMLVPTRQRVDKLRNMLISLNNTVERKDLFDVWIYVDHDDEETIRFLRSDFGQSIEIRAYGVLGERQGSQGEMLNQLWRRSNSNAGIYIGFADDFVFKSQGWDNVLRNHLDVGDRIKIGYITDETALPDQITIMAAPAEWINENGTFLINYFPYWFADSWIDQISQMVQQKIYMPIKVATQGGKGTTKHMRNLSFWSRFFLHTIPERIDVAQRLRLKIYADDPMAYLASQTLADDLVKIFSDPSKLPSETEMARMEATLSEEKGPPSKPYLEAEARARRYLKDVFNVELS